MKARTFEESLQKGKLAESKIARWLRERGWTIIPVYEIEQGQGKGPQIYTPNHSLVAPDLLAWKSKQFRFIEAKNKSVFTRYRRPNRHGLRGSWQTGIDLRHYRDYLKAAEHFGFDVWLMFLHESGVPDPIDAAYPDCPAVCPTGLYGNSIEALDACKDHIGHEWGPSGMVYWNETELRKLASVERLNGHEEEISPSVFDHSPLRGEQGILFNRGIL